MPRKKLGYVRMVFKVPPELKARIKAAAAANKSKSLGAFLEEMFENCRVVVTRR